MKTTKLAVSGLLLVFALTCVPTASAQLSISSTPISTIDGLYHIKTVIQTQTGAFNMNNLLLVRPEKVVLADTLPPGPYLPFINEIHNRTNGEHVGTVINTSWHFDHAGLNAEFRLIEGTDTIIAHWRAGDYMTEPHCIENILCMPALPDDAQPTQGVHGEMRLLLQDEKVILKTIENAHSGADLVVYLERANVVYTGDIYFGGMYPIIDRAAGGTVNGMLHGLNQILAAIDEDTIVVPSHGVLGNRQSVLEFAEMLEMCRKEVRALIARGLSEQEVMLAPSFADLDAKWGNGFIPGPVFRMILYRDLAPHRNKN